MEDPSTIGSYPLTIPISFGIKEIDALFWMRPFTVDTLQKRFRINKPYSVLYLQKVTTFKERDLMDPSTAKSLSFPVNEYNIEDVKEMFAEVRTWFFPDNIKEIWGENDQGMLVFNNDYIELQATAVDDFAAVRTALKVVPTTVEVAQGKYEPGVVFYINRQSNGVLLTQSQILRMCKFFKGFDFLAWNQFAMGCFSYARSVGRILSYQELRQQMEANRLYNSNFNGF